MHMFMETSCFFIGDNDKISSHNNNFNNAQISHKCTAVYAVYTGYNGFSKVPYFRKNIDLLKNIAKIPHFYMGENSQF